MILCPDCHSCKIKKNGHTHYGKQNHKCNDCGRQFVLNNEHTIDENLREIIRRALMERVSLRGICRILGVSLTWLLDFAVETWSEAPENLGALQNERAPIKLQVTGLQLDEMWSFVGKKKNKVWIWVVYEPDSKQIIAYHMGRRNLRAAQALWAKIPEEMRQHCYIETDSWEAFRTIIPFEKHWIGKTYTFYIESLFSAVRSRVSRLVRKSKSFSKKLENHEAAIRYFFWQWNLSHQPYM